MTITAALLLGLLQGLTEFLPVSSSGHLVLAQHILGYAGAEYLTFDVIVHLGTLLAVFIYFRRDLITIATSAVTQKDESQGRRWITMIIIGTIPTVIIGLGFEDWFKSIFGNPKLVAGMLLLTALILLLADRRKLKGGGRSRLTVPSSLLIGTAQGLAIIPGISRSGSTIATAIFTGLDPAIAARFSFLLSIPAILGASVLEMGGISGITAQQLPAYLLGFSASFISGYIAIDLLLKLVIKRRLWSFSIYLAIVGVLGLILI
ncbi:undecaprenyl-diphosphatase UppP [bacterium]|nr:undecaprenyl-diphosphatase UppP [bacterium]MBU1652676.1 undecaprenyl-diphosphatase UppP [bacterium]MBU1880836.1 undecaprenyl-diphosphatase UppP [bacterium]